MTFICLFRLQGIFFPMSTILLHHCSKLISSPNCRDPGILYVQHNVINNFFSIPKKKKRTFLFNPGKKLFLTRLEGTSCQEAPGLWASCSLLFFLYTSQPFLCLRGCFCFRLDCLLPPACHFWYSCKSHSQALDKSSLSPGL